MIIFIDNMQIDKLQFGQILLCLHTRFLLVVFCSQHNAFCIFFNSIDEKQQDSEGFPTICTVY